MIKTNKVVRFTPVIHYLKDSFQGILIFGVFADFPAEYHEEAVFNKTRSGNNQLLDKEGNLYTLKMCEKKSGKIWWKCCDLKCSANAVTIDAFVISWSGGHNHISGQKID